MFVVRTSVQLTNIKLTIISFAPQLEKQESGRRTQDSMRTRQRQTFGGAGRSQINSAAWVTCLRDRFA